MLTGKRLDLPDLTQQTYVDLLETDEHFTLKHGEPVRRQRINNNLLGNAAFCPTVRRTSTIVNFVTMDLAARCKNLLAAYPPELLVRALRYLYTKETKSSFEIENIKPDAQRTERFVSLLRTAGTQDLCTKPLLVDLQNQIVDPRFQCSDYRDMQSYVGESVLPGYERVHYVCPKPEQVAELMLGLIAAHRQMEKERVHPVVQAALIGYGFVFIHPFDDGNGRIHRLLIHNILSRSGFSPPGLVLPVSAVMLKDPAAYDASLEAYSSQLMEQVEYSLGEDGRMTVHNDASVWYRYPDMTAQVESLFAFIERAIETDLAQELAFLANYEKTKQLVQAIVDMPDRDIDLVIRFCLQNNGKLSQRKRESHFEKLTDDEITRLERAVAEGYKSNADGPRTN